MDLLKRLTIKNLMLNKKRTLVTIIGIILSVALITAVAAMYFSAINSLIKFEIRQKGNYHIEFLDVSAKKVESFEDNKDIEKIYITQDIGYSVLENSKNDYKPYAFVKSFSKDALENLAINLTEGRLPENENEIMIPTHLKTNGRIELKVGDTITFNIGTRIQDGEELTQDDPYDPDFPEEIVNTKHKTYRIVGICERPATEIEGYHAPGYTFITLLNDKNLTGKVDIFARYTGSALKEETKVTSEILGIDEDVYSKVMYNAYQIQNEEEWAQIGEAFDKAKYQINANTYLIKLEADPLGVNNSSTGGLIVVVAIICGIIIVTSVFCIKNSFDISITEKTKQYGMLRSVGATKKQVKKNVYFEAFVLGFIGIPLGILSGFLASFILVSNYLLRDMFSADGLKLVFTFSWIATGISILLGIITIWLSSVRSAKRASKITPILAIRNSGDIKMKAKKLKTPKMISKLFGIGGEISYKNLKRNKKKYRTTVISIVVSVAIFIAIYYFSTLVFDSVKEEYQVSDYNIDVYLHSNYDKNDIAQILNLDNIEQSAVLRTLYVNIPDSKYSKEYLDYIGVSDDEYDEIPSGVEIYTLGEAAYREYIKELDLKYDDVRDKAILYNAQNAYMKYDNNVMKLTKIEKYHYQVGDKVKAINLNSPDEEEINFEIAKVTDTRPFGTYEGVSAFIVSEEFFNKYKTDDLNTRIVIYSSNPDKLQDDIEEIIKDKDFSLNNMNENVRMMENFFILIAIFVYGFIIVISLIGVTNIFNTITTSMELRKPEFASLRSIGMTDKEFSRMIRLESLFMGFKSLAFGIIIGTGLSYLIYYYFNKNLAVVMKYQVPIKAIMIAVLVVFILISVIMRYSLRKIKKQNTIETIRNENI